MGWLPFQDIILKYVPSKTKASLPYIYMTTIWILYLSLNHMQAGFIPMAEKLYKDKKAGDDFIYLNIWVLGL